MKTYTGEESRLRDTIPLTDRVLISYLVEEKMQFAYDGPGGLRIAHELLLKISKRFEVKS